MRSRERKKKREKKEITKKGEGEKGRKLDEVRKFEKKEGNE